MKVLIDTNIMIDAITNRDGKSCFSAQVIDLCAAGKIAGYLAPHSLSNMYYILRKDYSDTQRRIILRKYSDILKIAKLNTDIVDAALDNNIITDFEDAIQHACAESIDADYIITRNTKDYAGSVIRALLPEELLSLMK